MYRKIIFHADVDAISESNGTTDASTHGRANAPSEWADATTHPVAHTSPFYCTFADSHVFAYIRAVLCAVEFADTDAFAYAQSHADCVAEFSTDIRTNNVADNRSNSSADCSAIIGSHRQADALSVSIAEPRTH